MAVTIRQEYSKDFSAVFELIKLAFQDKAFSDQTEHYLVDRLRQSSAFIPELSLVAIVDTQVVGHILLTKVKIKNETQVFDALTLAPVAVLPDYQAQGIGSQLILEAHKRAKDLGHTAVVLLGHEDYYPKFGYRPTNQFGIKVPFDVPAKNCMIVELVEGALKDVDGLVEYSKPFYE